MVSSVHYSDTRAAVSGNHYTVSRPPAAKAQQSEAAKSASKPNSGPDKLSISPEAKALADKVSSNPGVSKDGHYAARERPTQNAAAPAANPASAHNGSGGKTESQSVDKADVRAVAAQHKQEWEQKHGAVATASRDGDKASSDSAKAGAVKFANNPGASKDGHYVARERPPQNAAAPTTGTADAGKTDSQDSSKDSAKAAGVVRPANSPGVSKDGHYVARVHPQNAVAPPSTTGSTGAGKTDSQDSSKASPDSAKAAAGAAKPAVSKEGHYVARERPSQSAEAPATGATAGAQNGGGGKAEPQSVDKADVRAVAAQHKREWEKAHGAVATAPPPQHNGAIASYQNVQAMFG